MLPKTALSNTTRALDSQQNLGSAVQWCRTQPATAARCYDSVLYLIRILLPFRATNESMSAFATSATTRQSTVGVNTGDTIPPTLYGDTYEVVAYNSTLVRQA